MASWGFRRRGRRRTRPAPVVGDPTLVVVAEGGEATASSTALAEGGFAAAEPVVLRHTLWLPSARVEEIMARFTTAGYRADESVSAATAEDGLVLVAVAQTVVVDPVVLSRERARVSSVASRASGRVEGWALLRSADMA
ncbi:MULTISPECIES: hypothetical protein [Gordonia]|uniref:hypothetical protein n=1 Tax=Gordonia TaxID=2053 RepID=UPI00326786AD